MNVEKIYRYCDLARNISNTIVKRTHRHVSIIFNGNAPFAIASNTPKTHPMAARLGYQADELHSELASYLSIQHFDCSRMTLVNYRFNNSGELKMSRPCHRCIMWCPLTFKEVWYSTNEGSFVRL